MTINWLQSFLTLARIGSFSRAAEALFITQPALSRTIAELEQQVGCKLFRRKSRPVEMTAEGEVFYRWACILERNLNDMKADMDLASRGVIGRLRIGYYGEPQVAILNRGIEAIKKKTPEIKWSVYREHPMRLETLLFQGEIDATFLHLPHAQAFEWMDYVSVVPGGMTALLPADHPFANRKTMSLVEIADEPYVAFPRPVSAYAYDLEMQAFHEIGAIPRVNVLVDDIEALGLMVSGGNGFTLMSQASAEELKKNGLPVAAVTIQGFEHGFDLVIAWKRGSTNPYREAFCQAIRHSDIS